MDRDKINIYIFTIGPSQQLSTSLILICKLFHQKIISKIRNVGPLRKILHYEFRSVLEIHRGSRDLAYTDGNHMGRSSKRRMPLEGCKTKFNRLSY